MSSTKKIENLKEIEKVEIGIIKKKDLKELETTKKN